MASMLMIVPIAIDARVMDSVGSSVVKTLEGMTLIVATSRLRFLRAQLIGASLAMLGIGGG